MDSLQDLLQELGITTWDVLLIGDGSGTGWDSPAGWAVVLIDKPTRGRKLFYGAVNHGSINFAEGAPYFQALLWYHHFHGRDRLRRQGQLHVHVLTDSQVTTQHGQQANQLAADLPRANSPIWAGVREFVRLGYQLEFHWRPRKSSQLNELADRFAGEARRQLQQLTWDPRDVYFNEPWEQPAVVVGGSPGAGPTP